MTHHSQNKYILRKEKKRECHWFIQIKKSFDVVGSQGYEWKKSATDNPRVPAQLKTSLSWVWLFVAPWTAARQAPLSMELVRQEY